MMKKVFAIGMCALVLTASVFAASSQQWVSAKKVELKSGSDWFATTVATVSYGDEVTVLSTSGKWAEVQLASNKSKKGWIPTSSLTKKKIVASNGKVSANAKEIALAGKGFSSSLEDEYKGETKTDYAQVDAMEKISVSAAEQKKFIENGNLKGAK
ncbi:MAG: hypothetical protein II187_07365 [Treponema sp.]|nr:hypothetical protein [Treponema sp.]